MGMISVMPNTGLAIELQPAERTQLEQWVSAHGTPQQVALRCRIILRAVAGQQNVAIAAGLGVSRPTVQLWRKRVHEQGIGEVWEIAPGRGRKAHYDQGQRDRIIRATLQSKPKGMTHWSCRLMAEAQEVSKNTVNRLWQLHNLKPHLSRTFKLSRDAKFLEKLTDVVGVYMNPPDKALVLCLDEKSQIQALDRTQPGLPLKKGRCGTMTHDYKRNGTTTLFAALNVLDGKVIGECHGRHRHQEWLKFLRRLDAGFLPPLKLNLVERWFRELTEKAIRRGSFVSVPDLKQAIEAFMQAWNQNPKPFIWSATVEDIIKKIDRARVKMEQIKPGSTQPRGKKKTVDL